MRDEPEETKTDCPNNASDAEAADPGLVEQLREEVEDLRDKHLRAVAEFDNLRRRHDKEMADLRKFAGEGLLKDLLPVLDSFDKALGDDSEEVADSKSFRDGMAMVRKQLKEALARQGLEKVDTDGAKFDPNFHQAIQRQESDDVEEEQIGEVFVSGYTLNGRLLRPAMVSVLVPPT